LGTDTMAGGLGNDIYVVDNTGDVVTEDLNAGTDTIESSVTYTLGANVENLILTGAAAINGTGNTLNNTITGNTAANTLNGGAGTDTMAGGLGNDIYVVDNTGDVVTEDLNAGTDTVKSSITYTLGANVENLTLTGTAAINGTGNTLKNVLTGNSAVNILTGGLGNDVLTGLGGADTFRYTALTDSLLTGFDRITDFAIGTDRLDSPTAVTAANTKELGTVATFNQASISAVLTTAVFGANQAATFTYGSGIGTRTFLALNNATAGFSSTTDSIIEITGYSGLLTNLAIV
jgi:Ca2+-binding RTX toxin-like protein